MKWWMIHIYSHGPAELGLLFTKFQSSDNRTKRLKSAFVSSSEPSQIYPDVSFKCNIPNKEEMCTVLSFSSGVASPICLSPTGASLCQTRPSLNLFCNRQTLLKAKWRCARSWPLSTWASRRAWSAQLAIKWRRQIAMQCSAISWRQRWSREENQESFNYVSGNTDQATGPLDRDKTQSCSQNPCGHCGSR